MLGFVEELEKTVEANGRTPQGSEVVSPHSQVLLRARWVRRSARHQCKTPVRRPVQSAGPKAGARHRLQAAKIELEEPNSISRVSPKIFWLDYFPRLILGCR